MRTLAIFALGLMSLSAFAQDRDSEAARSFCDSRMSDSHSVQNIISNSDNQLYFRNQGGMFGGGVCWWHSRFTRSAAYLAIFDPSLPKPSDEEAKKIISRLRDRKGITLIPGFSNLRDFSLSYRDSIQSKLNDWQRSDGILKASWVKGLSGSSDVDPTKLEKTMDELYDRVSKGEVVYQMLQMPGVIAHAWLVSGMEKTDDGYKLQIIDSNIGNDEYTYRKGMTQFNYMGYYHFVPYTGQQGEEKKLMSKMTEFCTGKKPDSQQDDSNTDTNPET
jgi:hypothetical protein